MEATGGLDEYLARTPDCRLKSDVASWLRWQVLNKRRRDEFTQWLQNSKPAAAQQQQGQAPAQPAAQQQGQAAPQPAAKPAAQRQGQQGQKGKQRVAKGRSGGGAASQGA